MKLTKVVKLAHQEWSKAAGDDRYICDHLALASASLEIPRELMAPLFGLIQTRINRMFSVEVFLFPQKYEKRGVVSLMELTPEEQDQVNEFRSNLWVELKKLAMKLDEEGEN